MPGPKTKFITLACNSCGTKFERLLRVHHKNLSKGRTRNYCSLCKTHRKQSRPCINCAKATTNPKFCSRKCGITVNNKLSPKRSLEGKCQHCKKLISANRKFCGRCFKTNCRYDYETITLGQLLRHGHGNRNSYHTQVRQHAQRIARKAGLLKACKVCGYSFYVECCHIKSVSSFPRATSLIIVNSIDNLVGLCPNHHVELDKGHLKL